MKGGVLVICCILLVLPLVSAQIPNPGHEWPHLECTNVFCIDPISGNVGVGDVSPTTTFYVRDPSASIISVNSGSGGSQAYGAIDFLNDGAAMWGLGKDDSLGDFYIDRGGVGRAFTILASSRNVGIGTSNPNSKLHVAGGDLTMIRLESSASGITNTKMIFQNAERIWEIGNSVSQTSPGYFSIGFDASGGGPIAVIDTDGNLGIGTTDPGDKLHVVNNGDANSPVARFENLNNNVVNNPMVTLRHGRTSSPELAIPLEVRDGSDSVVISLKGDGSGYFIGNVGIGTTSPTQKFEVAGGIKLNSPPAQPVCDSQARGTVWHLRGAAGLRDRVEFCLKNADGTYTWQEIGAVVPPIDADNDGFPAFAAGGSDCVDTDPAINPASGVTCNYGVTCTLPPPDDSACGTISCSGWFAQSGIESPMTTETCFNKLDITINRCEDYNDCKDANSADCNGQSNNVAQFSCGTCKFISSSSCSGTTLGGCSNYASGMSCGAGLECDGSGNCVAIPVDADGDGFFSIATGGTDCYDLNANAKPGQTNFYTGHRGDGSFDYDCDGTETKRFSCVTGGNGPGCYNYQGGWQPTPPFSGGWVAVEPSCGSSGTFRHARNYFSSSCPGPMDAPNCGSCSSGSSIRSCQIADMVFTQTCR